MTSEEYLNHLKEVCLNDKQALDYLITMSHLFRVWDDVWDQDAKVDRDVVDKLFTKLSFDLSRNEFFSKNRLALESFTFMAWNSWKDSNELKGNDSETLARWAWYGRDLCNEIDILVAWLVGGTEHARSISMKSRLLYLNQLESRGSDGFFKE